MQIGEILPYSKYFCDRRFAKKIPDYTKKKVVYKCGDNIYEPLPNGDFRQLQSMHSDGTNENPKTKAHDLGGRNVLIASNFYYFGRDAIDLPEALEDLKVVRNHKNKFSEKIIAAFMNFITRQTTSINAPPTSWPLNDNSWKMEQL